MATLERFVSEEDVKTGVIDVLKEKFEETAEIIDFNKGGKTVLYDYDLKTLYLKNGDSVLSQTSLDASGGGLRPQDIISHSEVNLDEGVELKCSYSTRDVVINDQIIMEFAGVKIVQKNGSPPVNEHDGVVIYDTASKEQTGPTDSITQVVRNLNNGDTYYFGYFPYSKTAVYNYNTVASITPSEIIPPKPTNVTVAEDDQTIIISGNLPGDTYSLVGEEKFVVQLVDSEYVEKIGVINQDTGKYDCIFTDLENDTEYSFVYITRIDRTGFGAESRNSLNSSIKATPKDLCTYYSYVKDSDGNYIVNGVDVDRVVEDNITDIEIPTTRSGKQVIIS